MYSFLRTSSPQCRRAGGGLLGRSSTAALSAIRPLPGAIAPLGSVAPAGFALLSTLSVVSTLLVFSMFSTLSILSMAAPAHATIVAELDFVSIHRSAATLVHARCLARREVLTGIPVPYTEYTLEIVEAIKGATDEHGNEVPTLTVRHAGTRSGYMRADGLMVPPLRLGLPEYEVGDEVVLFLTRESAAGLCAPIGLGQGAFHVSRSEGKATVMSPLKNRSLLKGMPPATLQRLSSDTLGALRSQGERFGLDEFLDLCRSLKEPAKGEGKGETQK